MNDIIEHEGNAPSMSMVQHLVKAEIDQQISTAHAYPRSLSKVNKNVLDLVTISQDAAKKCTYALPRGGKPITGPSIRLAEIVASQWGNCRVGARVVHVDRKEMYVEAEGVFHDLQSNTATTARVRRRISDRNGRLFSDDMIIVTGNAACSIAKRNAILGGVPEAIWGEAYEAALHTLRGDMKTLPERRENAMKACAAVGLTPQQVYQILGIDGEKDFGLDQMATLSAMLSGIKNGEATVEELLKTADADREARRPGSIAATPKRAQDPEVVEDAKPAEKTPEQIEMEAEVERLRGIYADMTGQKPDGRWGIKALQEKIDQVQQDRMNAETGDADQSTQTPHDPETGEVMPDGKQAEQQDPAPRVDDGRDFDKIYNQIVNDLIDASDIDGVVDLYSQDIEAMKTAAPHMHTQLMEEIKAAKE